LLTSLLTTAQDLIPTIALSVRDTNPAKRLYERFGFVTVAEIINRVGGRSSVMTIALRRIAVQ
jgi:ribosomal protein S18 acetylase RimI-like enzyme